MYPAAPELRTFLRLPRRDRPRQTPTGPGRPRPAPAGPDRADTGSYRQPGPIGPSGNLPKECLLGLQNMPYGL
jgi:hypothetical protein